VVPVAQVVVPAVQGLVPAVLSLVPAVPVSGLMVHVLGLRKVLVAPTLVGLIRVDVMLHLINAVRVEFSREMGGNSPMVNQIESDSIAGSVVIFQIRAARGRDPLVTPSNAVRDKMVRVKMVRVKVVRVKVVRGKAVRGKAVRGEEVQVSGSLAAVATPSIHSLGLKMPVSLYGANCLPIPNFASGTSSTFVRLLSLWNGVSSERKLPRRSN